MASPQCENGYARIARELLRVIVRTDFKAIEIRILLAVIEDSYGWNRKTAPLSSREIARRVWHGPGHLTPWFERWVRKLISGLVVGKVLVKEGRRHSPWYGLQKDYELWTLPQKRNRAKRVQPGYSRTPKLGYPSAPRLGHVHTPSVAAKLNGSSCSGPG